MNYGLKIIIDENFDLVVDAIFGFSFKPPIRKPYDHVISQLGLTKKPIISVDIPSGWNVEEGNNLELFTPAYLISLTLPKIGVKEFKGTHYLGGRFVPKKFAKENNWILPTYEGLNHFIKL